MTPQLLSSALGLVNGQWSPDFNNKLLNSTSRRAPFTIATSSIRRKAQWLHRYPNHTIENLRGNVNTRLRKLNEHDWNGAIFAAAGLERLIFGRKILLILTGCYLRRHKEPSRFYAEIMMIFLLISCRF